jgi:membrane-associated phospholipid phosphatase
MALALVYSGEHYVVDCLAGWVYAVSTFLAVNWAFERRAQRVPQYEPALAEPALAD